MIEKFKLYEKDCEIKGVICPCGYIDEITPINTHSSLATCLILGCSDCLCTDGTEYFKQDVKEGQKEYSKAFRESK